MTRSPSEPRGGDLLLKSRFAKLAGLSGLASMFALALVGDAFATGTADSSTVTAVTSSTDNLTATIQAAIPLILGVTAVMVVLSLGRKLVRKAG